MPNELLRATDSVVEQFDRHLFKVLQDLDGRILDIIATAKTGKTYDAAVVLNSRPAMIQALRESGYSKAVESYLAQYEDVPKVVKKMFGKRDLPAPRFTTADVETFKTIARADLEAFNIIGTKAVDDLRLGLYRQAVGNAPFSELVASIRASTVGIDKKGSPLKNYAYTHANTAHLSFNGEVMRVAGENIGAEKWEVVGPSDNVTRSECLDALANPIRTTEEWQSVGYFGGTPGGWNCRHMLYPVFDDD